MATIYLEQFIAQGFSAIIGNPLVLGIMLMGIFTGFVLLQGLRLDGKVAILVPVSLLAITLIPWFAVLIGLAVGVLLYLAIMLFTQK